MVSSLLEESPTVLKKPDLKDEEIVKCINDAYGLDVKVISFLPIGADFNTAVYRVTTSNRVDYFLKLRSGEFFQASVLVPKYLADLGIKQVIPPLASRTGQLWASLASFKAILYPYVDGRAGVEAKLSDQQWIEFGKTMKKFHGANIPPAITSSVQRETFSSKWRETVKTFLSDSGRTPTEEESLFYQGYGQTEINQTAICYYRFERIIQDVGEYCKHIFLSDEGDEDRIKSFEYLQSIFLPDGAIERAYQSDKMGKVL